MPRVLRVVFMMRTVPSPVRQSQPADVPVGDVLVTPPVRRSSEFAATDQYLAAGAMIKSLAITFVPARLVKMPLVPGFRVRKLPLRVKPSLANRSQPMLRLLMSFTVSCRVVPLKIRLSLLTGAAIPNQFVVVLQLPGKLGEWSFHPLNPSLMRIIRSACSVDFACFPRIARIVLDRSGEMFLKRPPGSSFRNFRSI